MEENSDFINENRRTEQEPLKKDPVDSINEKEKNINENTVVKKLNNKIENKEIVLNQEINNQNVANKAENAINIKPKKEIPIEKKPFCEFVNDYLLPSLIREFKERGFEVLDISLKNTTRPIAGDKCWVINCEIKDTCKFWLSFEKEDISSLKSISICRSSQKPSVIESFLIDEKRITLKLIISRILQRLNGQKLIGVN